MSVAIVDDEKDLTDLFCEALKVSGYDVCGFTEPFVAYNHIRENPKKYSVLITDYRLPDINGLELARKILEIDQEMKVIIISAFDELEQDDRFVYIKKIVPLADLLDLVNRISISDVSKK